MEGLLEGREEGLNQGKLEKARETAIKMKNKGFDTVDISYITGLSKLEIDEL